MTIHKALSIRQPWAWLIVRPDLVKTEDRAAAVDVNELKDVENRTWETLYRGPILIHAGQTMTRADYEACLLFLESDPRLIWLVGVMPDPAELKRGGIVGRADIVGCKREHASPWFVGDFGFELADVQPLPFRPFKGRLGMFNVPDELLA